MSVLHALIAILGLGGLAVAAGYGSLTLLAVLVWRMQRPLEPVKVRPPVTLLKPLCGSEPGLYEHLRSFCQQDYPAYQIIFGVRDAADPACAVARRLAEEFPALPIDLVINPQLHGTNRKVSNLINMLERARHDLIVMADSDAFVESDYLAVVTQPLLDRTVGLVTCPYLGVPTPRIWSRIGAMYINEWYVPSILVAWLFGYQGYVSGQTMCVRQETLRAIGGLAVIADHLADDHQLGELVRGIGLRTVLSPYVVKGEHDEPSYASLTRHEMRWMRTIHVLRPMSFRLIFLSFSFPLAVVSIALLSLGAAVPAMAWGLFAAAATLRLALHCVQRPDVGSPPLKGTWLVPVRDGLLCWVWFRSFFTSRITWRGNEFDVDQDGFMRHPTFKR